MQSVTHSQRSTRGSLLSRLASQRLRSDPTLGDGAAAAPSRGDAPTFRNAALAVQSLLAPEWMLSGPSETGKTWATLWRLDQLLRTTPNAQAALMRKVRSTIGPTVLRTYLRVIARSQSGAAPFGGKNPEWYDYPNGARLWIGGMDDPGKVLSGERDFIYINQAEELNQDDWETLSTRATGRGAVTETPMLFGDCNPGPADHWILRRRDAGALMILESRHEDNPSLYDDNGELTAQGTRTMAVLSALTGVRKQRLRYGLWVGAEGQFFEAWDAALHVCDPFAIPADWPIWGAFDYGFVHNTAFGLFTRHEDQVYLIGEHVQNKATVRHHAEAIKALCARLRVPVPAQIVAGHDVFSNRGDSAGMTIAEQYEAHGLTFERADIDRINGAAVLMERLGTADQPPTFQAFTTCHRTITTIPTMVHDPRRPEDVLKVDSDASGAGGDDAYDMLRYGLMVSAGQLASVPAVGGQRPYQGYRPQGVKR